MPKDKKPADEQGNGVAGTLVKHNDKK